MIGALVAAALAAAAQDMPPAQHAAGDLFVRFERIGYRGAIYLNTDGTYVIVQTSPAKVTEAFNGRWRRNGATGICLEPASGAGGKCVPQLPQRLGQAEDITSDLGELYRLTLTQGR
jgi:hypothetical protein